MSQFSLIRLGEFFFSRFSGPYVWGNGKVDLSGENIDLRPFDAVFFFELPQAQELHATCSYMLDKCPTYALPRN